MLSKNVYTGENQRRQFCAKIFYLYAAIPKQKNTKKKFYLYFLLLLLKGDLTVLVKNLEHPRIDEKEIDYL
ncbi:hypothetical protein BpHYR1_003097 [Brachionus plicatilis]|uniref:Uncharacterized protein n=1 Tax=Brachionus plicatilis TaxID=10195 RepID=A0A3M7SAK8_BRAPC|nr:hypothetical protein BpHYR1_003097 [Brachionus plicatilis]